MASLICNMDADFEKLLICTMDLDCMKALQFDTEVAPLHVLFFVALRFPQFKFVFCVMDFILAPPMFLFSLKNRNKFNN